MGHNERIDQIIESALTAYSAVNPEAGLDQRVVKRVRKSRAKRRTLAVCATAAALLLVVVLRQSSGPDGVQGLALRRAPSPPAPTWSEPLIRPKSQTKSRPRLRTKRRLPKRESFPAPSPLTREERILLAFVRRDPATARQLLSSIDHSITPLEEKQ